LPVSSAYEVIKSNFNLQMSASNESDASNRHGCDSDGELSVASSYGSEVQDCRKRPRQAQIQGNSWVLRAQIINDQQNADSDSMAAGPEGEVENEDRITKINTRLQRLFGSQFKILFGKLHGNVVCFVVFCNLINILDVGAVSSDAVKIKIEIRGFLQLRKPRAVTALQKLLSPFAPALSGCWERCVGGLSGHAGYTECLRPESTWFKLHHTGEFGNNNRGKHQAKIQAEARRLANQVFLGSGAFAMLCGF
jgi:hypothetical protein